MDCFNEFPTTGKNLYIYKSVLLFIVKILLRGKNFLFLLLSICHIV